MSFAASGFGRSASALAHRAQHARAGDKRRMGCADRRRGTVNGFSRRMGDVARRQAPVENRWLRISVNYAGFEQSGRIGLTP